MIKSWMCKGGWIEYAGGNYPVKLQKYKNDVKYLQIFRGGGIECAGGNYRVKLPPQSPQCSVWLVMRKRGSQRHLYFPCTHPTDPCYTKPILGAIIGRCLNIRHYYIPMQLTRLAIGATKNNGKLMQRHHGLLQKRNCCQNMKVQNHFCKTINVTAGGNRISR